MHYIYISLMLCVHLCLFGAARDKEKVSYTALEQTTAASIMTITQGESNLPFAVAFGKSRYTSGIIACIVADAKLKEYFSGDIAGQIVDGCETYGELRLENPIEWLKREKLQNICLRNTNDNALRLNITGPRLVTLFLFKNGATTPEINFYTLQQKTCRYVPYPFQPIGYKSKADSNDWAYLYETPARRELAARGQLLSEDDPVQYDLRIDFDTAAIKQIVEQKENFCAACQLL